MYIIWLIFMALFVGYLAVPIARKAGYSYGRFGRVRDILVVVVGALVFGVLVVMVLSAVGIWTGNEFSAVIVGFIGTIFTVILLTIFSVREAMEEDNIPNHGNFRELSEINEEGR